MRPEKRKARPLRYIHRTELAQLLSEKAGVSAAACNAVLRVYPEVIRDLLVKCHGIKIAGFGEFKLRPHTNNIGNNKDSVTYAMHFRSHMDLRKFLHEHTAEIDRILDERNAAEEEL